MLIKVKGSKRVLAMFLVTTLIASLFLIVPGNNVVQAASVTPVFNPDNSQLIGRSDLNYTGQITSGTQGIPVANGRFGGPVWESSGNTLSMQLNHTDTFMFNDASAVAKDHTNSGGGGLGRVHVGFGSGTVFNSSTTNHLSLYDSKLSINGASVSVNVIPNMNSNVIALQISDNRATPQPITVDLTMLRPASEVWGAHTSTSTLSTHTDNKTVILEQVFREACDTGITTNDYYCNTALAVTVQGRTVSSISDSTVGSRTAKRLNLPAQAGTFTVIIGGDSTMSTSVSAKSNAISNAVNSTDYNTTYTATAAWWSSFWNKSYVYLPSQSNFEQRRDYYMYLAAISNRGNYPSKYNGGIWIGEEDRRDWGSYFWNWNQDSLYHPFMEANHIELMDPMFTMRENSYAQYQTAASQMWGASGLFIAETAGALGWETVPTAVSDSMKTYYNFTNSTRAQVFTDMTARRNTFLTPWNWSVFGGNSEASYTTHTMMATQETAEYYWQKYCYTQDINWLRDHAYAFIKGAAELYRTYPGFKKDADGKYHFYNTNLHEHIWAGKDVIDDLSMARGVFAAAVKASQLLGVDSDLAAQWTDRLSNIAPYPLRTDAGALWAGSVNSSMNTSLATSSPAFAQGRSPDFLIRGLDGTESPIFKMLEKYDVLNLETRDQGLDNGNWAIALNTYLHSPGYLNQVTGTVVDQNGSSRFHEDAAKFGRAVDMAHILNTQYGVFTVHGVYPNLLFDQGDYYSAEGYGTFSAALQDGLNQSLAPTPTGDPVIRVFPAWPTTWDSKYKLLAKNGFLVSSSMVSGDIQYVELNSQLGGTCRIRNPWSTNVVLYRNGVQAETITSSSNALMNFNTTAGEDIVLVRPGTTPDQYRTSSLGGGGTQVTSMKLEAESATLSSGAVVATDHTGYSGTGFVAGYTTQGATTTFNVSVPTQGTYNVDLRYSAGSGAKAISIYVNGTKIKQTSLTGTTNWDTWADKIETLTLNAGSNTIAYKYDTGDSGWVNLDYITLPLYQAENASLSSGAVVATDHTGYSGTGFVAGYTTQGATTTFTVNAQTQGTYNVDLRYGAGNGAETVSIYVNGTKIKQTSLAATANWDTWADKTEALTLNAGSNTIAYKYDTGDSGWINLDCITLR